MQILKLKEEDRLASTIFFLNEEAVAIPRGALFQRPDAVVVENLSYEGMSPIDSFELKCYQHWRKPRTKWNTNLLTRPDYNFGIDFMDTLEGDIPEGCWTIQKVAGGTVVVLTSLYWPGMMAYNYVNKPKYGFVYFGNGRKTLDLTFMLNPL